MMKFVLVGLMSSLVLFGCAQPSKTTFFEPSTIKMKVGGRATTFATILGPPIKSVYNSDNYENITTLVDYKVINSSTEKLTFKGLRAGRATVTMIDHNEKKVVLTINVSN